MAAVSIRNLDDTSARAVADSGGRPRASRWRLRCAPFSSRRCGSQATNEGVLGALAERFGELGGIDLDAPFPVRSATSGRLHNVMVFAGNPSADTNVVSELMKAEPSTAVRAWVFAHGHHELRITAITVAEILYGIQRLPERQTEDGPAGGGG